MLNHHAKGLRKWQGKTVNKADRGALCNFAAFFRLIEATFKLLEALHVPCSWPTKLPPMGHLTK